MKILRRLLCGAMICLAFTFAVNVDASTMYTTKTVRIRKEASTKSAIVDTLAANTEVVVYGIEGDWADILYNGVDGYIHKDYLANNPVETTKKTTTKKSTSTTTKKSTQAVSATTTNDDGIEIITTAKVTKSRVNFRKKANGKVIRTFEKDEKVRIISQKSEWVKVKAYLDGKTGYIHEDYLYNKVSRPSRKKTIALWKKQAVQYCKDHLNDTYSQEKRDEEGYADCSSLMRDAFLSVTGQYIGGYTVSQMDNMEKYTYTINNLDDVAVGDIVYHKSGENENHTGIYIGNRKVINASQTKGYVKISEAPEGSTYWEIACKAAAYCYDLKYKK